MKYLTCTSKDQNCDWLTVGKSYDVILENAYFYDIIDDDSNYTEVVKETLVEDPTVTSFVNTFELVEDTQTESDDTQVGYVCTEDEEELFRKLEQEQKKAVDCPVAIAYHIHELQKWLKHIGCSSETEFRISSDYVWASPDEFVIYEAKEGGVGTLIEYMRHIGGANKCVEKMEDIH